LESCPSLSDGGKDDEEESSESNDLYWTAVLPVEQGVSSTGEVEVRSVEVAGEVWFGLSARRARSSDERDD
jgi:hypothetical protein